MRKILETRTGQTTVQLRKGIKRKTENYQTKAENYEPKLPSVQILAAVSGAALAPQAVLRRCRQVVLGTVKEARGNFS